RASGLTGFERRDERDPIGRGAHGSSVGPLTELLGQVVARVSHVDVAGRVGCNPPGVVEPAFARTRASPLANERSRRREFLNSVVVQVSDVDVARAVDCDSVRELELAFARTLASPCSNEGSR